ncbi:hypothetical protein ES705_43259 [subsurface metagenome]
MNLRIVNCKIVTIPFNQQAESFPTEDLERFMTGKKIKSIKAVNFRIGVVPASAAFTAVGAAYYCSPLKKFLLNL